MVIGNPPYVEYGTKLKSTYTLQESTYSTIPCANLHAFIAERCFCLTDTSTSKIGLIVPLPSMNTARMISLQRIIKPTKRNEVWISAYDERPSGLFSGVDQRLIIEIIHKSNLCSLHTTGINRWLSANRNLLFPTLRYSNQATETIALTASILKQSDMVEASILHKFYRNREISYYIPQGSTGDPIFYRTAGGRYWKVFLDKPFGTGGLSEKSAYISEPLGNLCCISLLSSDLFWWYYSIHFDMFNLKDYMIFGFRYTADETIKTRLIELGKRYLRSLIQFSEVKQINSKTKGQVSQRQYYVRKSKDIINEIDTALSIHYEISEKELDFIISYDMKFRMGDEDD